MAVTPYLRLQKPPFDSIPWDQAINGNMDILDSTIAQYLSIPNFGGTWANATNYTVGQVILDATTATQWQCNVSHASAVVPTTFAQDRSAHPTYWSNVTTAPAVQANIGRNLLHNPMFNVAQRGVGPWTANFVYTLDRWEMVVSLDTASITQNVASDAVRTSIGDEAAAYILSNTFAGNVGAASYNLVEQKIENVRRLSGKPVTVSFYAAANVTLKLGAGFYQFFGSGGSPSAAVTMSGQSVTIGGGWARYSLAFVLPSVAGKTLGTNGDDYTTLQFWFSSGTTQSVNAGNVGVQSGTIQLWGVQLEIGSVATPLEKPDPRYDLANCQRFYQLVPASIRAAATGIGTYACSVSWQTMRATPTITTITAPGNNLVSSFGLVASGLAGGAYSIQTTAAGDCYSLNGIYGLSADL